ncbi:ABC transporter ATP-binding protein [Microbispora siamensis]|nr:ABC transporter ATP-binding protein [Microbispora siamensis]
MTNHDLATVEPHGAGEPPTGPPYRLEAVKLSKAYGQLTANHEVSLRVTSQSVHAVLGENGAGKSTLMKMLYGVEQPDSGQIRLDGVPVKLPNPKAAVAHGIGMVFQHFGLVPSLTAAENIALGVEPGRPWRIDKREILDSIGALSDAMGLHVDLKRPVARMSTAQQQRVEILKALYRGARVLILDEPTALLTPQERRALFDAVRRLTEAGTTVLFITHKLSEVAELADDVTILRRGHVVGHGRHADFNTAQLVELMVGGRPVTARRAPAPLPTAPKAASFTGLSVTGSQGREAVHGVSLDLREGEVCGLVGVDGNGQLEFLEGIAGIRPVTAGRIEIGGVALRRWTHRRARAAGLGYVPEDRLSAGVVPAFPIVDNMFADRITYGGYRRHGRLDKSRMRSEAVRLIEDFDIRCTGPLQPAERLSGGNIQKVVLAREISRGPKVLLVAEPTRGLDIGAAARIHEALADAAREGTAILVLSSDVDEVLAISSRICVFHEGRLVADLVNGDEVTAEIIGALMLGSAEDGPADSPAASPADVAPPAAGGGA